MSLNVLNDVLHHLHIHIILQQTEQIQPCAQRRSQKVNQATPSLSHSPVKAPVPVIARMPDETDAKQILTGGDHWDVLVLHG